MSFQKKRALVKVQRAVEAFLTERRTSECGGWAEVTTEDLRMFYNVLDLLKRAKWELDADGDLPVEVEVVDRTRFERLQYSPLPYGRSDGDAANILDEAMSNLSLATDDVRRCYRKLREAGRAKEI